MEWMLQVNDLMEYAAFPQTQNSLTSVKDKLNIMYCLLISIHLVSIRIEKTLIVPWRRNSGVMAAKWQGIGGYRFKQENIKNRVSNNNRLYTKDKIITQKYCAVIKNNNYLLRNEKCEAEHVKVDKALTWNLSIWLLSTRFFCKIPWVDIWFELPLKYWIEFLCCSNTKLTW